MSEKIKLNKEQIAILLVDYETIQKPMDKSLEHLSQSVEEILRAIATMNPAAALSLVESISENIPTFRKIAEQHDAIREEGYKKLLEQMEE